MAFNKNKIYCIYLAVLVACHTTEKAEVARTSAGTMSMVSIVPRKSIGRISIGTKIENFGKETVVKNGVGVLDGIKFGVTNGAVDDVWIDDIHSFPRLLQYDEKIIQSDISLESIKSIFGPCTEVSGIKGGTFFNCDSGVAIGIGCKVEGVGKSIQIRVRHR